MYRLSAKRSHKAIVTTASSAALALALAWNAPQAHATALEATFDSHTTSRLPVRPQRETLKRMVKPFASRIDRAFPRLSANAKKLPGVFRAAKTALSQAHLRHRTNKAQREAAAKQETESVGGSVKMTPGLLKRVLAIATVLVLLSPSVARADDLKLAWGYEGEKAPLTEVLGFLGEGYDPINRRVLPAEPIVHNDANILVRTPHNSAEIYGVSSVRKTRFAAWGYAPENDEGAQRSKESSEVVTYTPKNIPQKPADVDPKEAPKPPGGLGGWGITID